MDLLINTDSKGAPSMLPDPLDLTTVLTVSAAIAMAVTDLVALSIHRSIVRAHIELVHRTAALPPGTRIVSRHGNGALRVTTAHETVHHGH